jgi:hypothetical protein
VAVAPITRYAVHRIYMSKKSHGRIVGKSENVPAI